MAYYQPIVFLEGQAKDFYCATLTSNSQEALDHARHVAGQMGVEFYTVGYQVVFTNSDQ